MNIEIKTTGKAIGSEVFIDGKRLNRVKKVEVSIDVETPINPVVTIAGYQEGKDGNMILDAERNRVLEFDRRFCGGSIFWNKQSILIEDASEILE